MKQISRRRAMAAAGAGSAGFMFFPARVLGRGGAVPPSEKLGIAFIGIGGRGSFDLRELSSQNVVALCDVDWRAIRNYPYPRASEMAAKFPQARRYDDWRIMLREQDKNIDAVVVAAPDHVHAIASITAMKMGKHVYCETPLAPSIHEVRAMNAAERQYGVTTQAGNQGHSSEDCRLLVEWLRDGIIGDIQDVQLYRGIGTMGVDGHVGVPYSEIARIVNQNVPVPKGLNWDLWLGPAAARKFNPAYLPSSWQSWMEFGGGPLGAANCHLLDPIAWALDLQYPDKIVAHPENQYDPATNSQTHPNSAEVQFDFPARGKRRPVTVIWHYGFHSGRLAMPPGWGEDTIGDRLSPAGGGIITGTRGAIIFGPLDAGLPLSASAGEYKPVTWGTPAKLKFFPRELEKSYKRPDKSLSRPVSHWMEWVEAAKARKPAGSPFAYGGLLTEIALMGNIACRQKGKVLYYDAETGQFKNNDEANKLLRRPYRDGWVLPA